MLNFKNYYVTEAFLSKDLSHALDLIQHALEKKLGTKLYKEPSPQQFKNNLTSAYGIVYFIGNTTQAIRLNFNGNEIVGVDIWSKESENKSPVVNIDTKGINIISIIQLIVDQIREPKTGEFEVIVNDKKIEGVEESFNPKILYKVVSEASPIEIDGITYNNNSQAAGALLKKGYAASDIVKRFKISAGVVYTVAQKLGMTKKVQVRGVKEEVVVDGQEVKKSQKELDEQHYADPRVVFQDLEELIKLVVSGRRNSLICTGSAGLGKSFAISKVINDCGLKEDKDYVIVKGKSTSLGLYSALYNYNGKVLIFDDCDSLFRSEDSINILKGALDSNRARKISWLSKVTFDPSKLDSEEIEKQIEAGRYPNNFLYYGKIIFASNINYIDLDKALVSRSLVIDIRLKQEDILLRIESILPAICKDVEGATLEKKKILLDYFKEIVSENKLRKEMSVRTFVNALDILLSGSSRWKELVERYS